MSNYWQPIETAPRDGTPILVWIGDRLIEAKWNPDLLGPDESSEDGGWESRWAEIYSFGAGEVYPTHWMPLPEPPETGHADSIAAPAGRTR